MASFTIVIGLLQYVFCVLWLTSLFEYHVAGTMTTPPTDGTGLNLIIGTTIAACIIVAVLIVLGKLFSIDWCLY